MRAEAHSSKTRHLGIMDICNRDSSDQESESPTSNKAGSKKRHHGQEEAEDKGEEPKPRRRRLPSSKRERQECLSSSSPDPVARSPSTKSDPVSEADDNDNESADGNATELADDASPPTARARTEGARRPSGGGQHNGHNLIEKKYRQKLNSHFKRLLDVLPAASSTPRPRNSRKSTPSAPPPPPSPPPPRALSFISVKPGGKETPKEERPASAPPPPPPIPSFLSQPPGGGEGEAPNSSRVRIPLPPLTLTSPEPVVVSARAATLLGGAGASNTTRSTTSGSSGSEQDSAGTGGTAERKRISKGDILERARLYIEALEQKQRRLMAEKMELESLWEENYKSKETAGAGRKVPN